MSSPITSSDFENQTPGQPLCDAFQEKLLNNSKIAELLDYLFTDPAGLLASTFITDLMPFQSPIGSYKEFPLEVSSDVSNPDNGAIYLEANGQSLLQADYPRLFAYLGTTFNQVADTAGTFRVPDRSAKFHLPRSGSHAQTSTGGAETHQLTEAEMPEHKHFLATNETGGDGDDSLASDGQMQRRKADGAAAGDYRLLNSATEATIGLTSATGGGDDVGGDAHENMPPYLTGVTYIVAGYKVDGTQI